MIISFPFWLRWLLQTSFLCFENLAKINFVISVSIIPWLFSGSLACWQLWSFGGYSTDLPTYFHWHQFSFIHALLCTEYSLNKHAVQDLSWFAWGIAGNNPEVKGWMKGWWRLGENPFIRMKILPLSPSPVREMCTENDTLHPNMVEQCHPAVRCWSWFDLNSTEP